MPAQRNRNIPDDARSEASSSREKHHGTLSTMTLPKGRRNGAGNVGVASGLKEVTNANQPSSEQQDAHEDEKKIDWSKMETSVLLAYRNFYQLEVPPSFANLYRERMLTRPGIGKFSPTMARQKSRQRASRAKLVMAVKKSFNNAMVTELDIITSFTYSVDNKDKKFRMRFEPPSAGR